MIKNFLLSVLCVGLVSCVTYPPYVSKELPFKYGNDCLPQAIIMTESLKKHGVDAKVLSIFTDKWGHAICVYMYPPGKNQMWGWDRIWMSMRLRAWKNDPESVAKEWMRVTMSQDKFVSAEYRE